MIGTHYNILGLSEDATPDEIKKAYRKLSIKFHPDKNEGDEYFSQMFRQINTAYLVLSDDEKRKKYDAQLKQQANAQSSAERIRKLEQELAYQESVLKQQTAYSSIIERNERFTHTQTEKPNATIKIKHVKYFLWLVIVFIVLFIGAKGNKSDIDSTPQEKTYHKAHRKHKKKKRKKSHSQELKTDETKTEEVPIEADTVEVQSQPIEPTNPVSVDSTSVNP